VQYLVFVLHITGCPDATDQEKNKGEAEEAEIPEGSAGIGERAGQEERGQHQVAIGESVGVDVGQLIEVPDCSAQVDADGDPAEEELAQQATPGVAVIMEIKRRRGWRLPGRERLGSGCGHRSFCGLIWRHVLPPHECGDALEGLASVMVCIICTMMAEHGDGGVRYHELARCAWRPVRSRWRDPPMGWGRAGMIGQCAHGPPESRVATRLEVEYDGNRRAFGAVDRGGESD